MQRNLNGLSASDKAHITAVLEALYQKTETADVAEQLNSLYIKLIDRHEDEDAPTSEEIRAQLLEPYASLFSNQDNTDADRESVREIINILLTTLKQETINEAWLPEPATPEISKVYARKVSAKEFFDDLANDPKLPDTLKETLKAINITDVNISEKLSLMREEIGLYTTDDDEVQTHLDDLTDSINTKLTEEMKIEMQNTKKSPRA